MAKRIIITASVLGALAVILGAFGAHALKRVLEVNELEIWAKGVEYQFYHTFALLFLSQVKTENTKLIHLSYLSFSLGILLFSGSLYLLATRTVLNIGFVDYIGPVTPIGGLLLIMGWVLMLAAALKHK
ncbi:DUF423 domain-containing protein [Pedobacter metabolipauper]|uniref:Uncharacterized membrane protein YgdD (TMEM256/DUF423 family) n=1 Tax=Pedobacter metabolipauper TaxID=425513 RepID=A0A4R6SQE4_9SPHI|nr:DUF423 domain-containing protein [Pedobacter metabolipauper]TDQ06454.1 uncharacterized membrane protein YgdD (TMEM256/DUF423 family) [Pedobacter metabolipauper]